MIEPLPVMSWICSGLTAGDGKRCQVPLYGPGRGKKEESSDGFTGAAGQRVCRALAQLRADSTTLTAITSRIILIIILLITLAKESRDAHTHGTDDACPAGRPSCCRRSGGAGWTRPQPQCIRGHSPAAGTRSPATHRD